MVKTIMKTFVKQRFHYNVRQYSVMFDSEGYIRWIYSRKYIRIFVWTYIIRVAIGAKEITFTSILLSDNIKYEGDLYNRWLLCLENGKSLSSSPALSTQMLSFELFIPLFFANALLTWKTPRYEISTFPLDIDCTRILKIVFFC